MRTSLFLAASENDVIGRDNDLPWHLPADLRRFKSLTSGHVLVCGRRNHESIVNRLGRPLPGRITVVTTRQVRPGEGPVIYQPSVTAALSVARAIEEFAGKDEVFVIGGAQIYTEALPEADIIYLTRVHAEVEGDVRMPAGWLDGFKLVESEPGPAGEELPYTFERYERG
ncbi:dihydrofolate reductase [Planosporangium flavigriseum]|uniref:Dihydrofolate reductase n=1 Tax=Planosporangium flavigriseum TaxID=373681 RepID=A0A8J3M0C1_9ACTN|nr:dihydrofolate reductase [Planosporangium flavigriseum]NJC66871.1 dihydrofolate reductase [Planosporangium flavigriseum]GIG74385.1 dihydrofolate reductase [Planosporangium flavigriseum]